MLLKVSHKVPLISSVIIIIAFSIFSWFQYNIVRSSLYKNIEGNIEESSVVLAYQITNWLNGKLALVDMMAETISADFNLNTIQKTMNTPLLRDEFILVFGALESDGQPISNDPSWYPGDGWDARIRPWYPLARSHKQALLTDPYADSATNDILISAVANFYDKGIFKGAFGGDISLKTVSDAINTLNFSNTGYAFLLNNTGEIISHPNSSLNGKHMSALFTNGLPRLKSELQERTINNKKVLTSFRPLDNLYGSKWLIGVVLEKDKVMSDAYALNINAIIGAILTSLASCFILYIIMKKLLIKPIDRLTSVADQISRGRLLGSEIEGVDRNDEIGALARSIDRMSKGLQIAIIRLRKKK